MNTDILDLARNIADVIYKDIPKGINEPKKKELAQRIAIELTNKVCNNLKHDNIYTLLEYELWCEYELMLSSDTRKRIYALLEQVL